MAKWRKRAALRRVSGAAAALVLVAGAGTASATFVDYLAERAKLRAYTEATMTKPAEQVTRPSGPAAAAPASVQTAASPRPDPKPAVAPEASAITRAAKKTAASGVTLPGKPASETIAAKAPVETAAAIPLPDKTVLAALRPQPNDTAESSLERNLGAVADPRDDIYTGAIAYAPVAATGVTTTLPDGSDDTGRTAKVTKHVNLRSRPEDKSKVLTVVPARASVNVLSCKSWCEVEYDGQKGFIYKRFIGKS